MKNNKSGFTLLEILLVVAAIGILAGIVVFAVNPAKQLGDTRNAQRKVDVNTLINALYQYSIDNHGEFPVEIPGSSTEICNDQAGDCGSLIELSGLTSQGKYLTALPMDPEGSGINTGYFISADSYNHITIQAIHAENGVSITVTK